MYVIILTFQYLTGFSDIRITKAEEQQELSYIQSIKDSFIQTLSTSNYSSNGDLNKIVKDVNFTKNLFIQELSKKGIDFDSKFIIFSNGFETGDTSGWTGTFNTPDIANDVNYNSSYSLHSTGIEYVYQKLSGLKEVYARVYINFNTLPSNSNGHYFIGFYENGNNILGLGLFNDQGIYKLRAYSDSMSNSWNSSGITVFIHYRPLLKTRQRNNDKKTFYFFLLP